MSGENHSAERGDLHRDCWELLPWLVNGRLGAPERASVEAHLGECQACRDELAAQRQLRERMVAREAVTHSPAASFEKLWTRIEEVDREVATEAAHGDGTREGTGREERAAREDAALEQPSYGRRARSRRAPIARWLVAAVVVQSIALAWVVSVLLAPSSPQDWPYRTVTSPAPAATGVPRVRVVFTRDASIAEVEQMLARRGLVIVNGPSAADVFILEPAIASAPASAGSLVEQLRAESLVRFAEPAVYSPHDAR